ncbi:MAG: hypothetical protein LBC97_00210 [Bifidobacteriaceae bacterium]|nr:hypothetical protein [Bifidobacteriaceae bacterium]
MVVIDRVPDQPPQGKSNDVGDNVTDDASAGATAGACAARTGDDCGLTGSAACAPRGDTDQANPAANTKDAKVLVNEPNDLEGTGAKGDLKAIVVSLCLVSGQT